MRRDTAWAARAAAASVLLFASVWAAAAGASAPSAPGRFTITRTLPDGRTEIRSVTLDELKAMSRPAPPAAARPMAGDTVVFALPPPIPDAVAPAPRPVVAVAAAPVAAPAPAAPSLVAFDEVTARRAATQAPSAAAIRVATANRTAALRTPMILTGGWTLATRDQVANTDEEDEDSAAPARLGASLPAGKPRKGAKAPLGVRDGRSFGDQGRFYLYAGVKNRGLGLNLTDHNGSESGGWGSDGVSYDKGGFSGQRSAGVGWRQGDVATSLGWVHEKNNIKGMYGAPAEKDDRVSLTFNWRPSVK